jgi:hypothetical protein
MIHTNSNMNETELILASLVYQDASWKRYHFLKFCLGTLRTEISFAVDNVFHEFLSHNIILKCKILYSFAKFIEEMFSFLVIFIIHCLLGRYQCFRRTSYLCLDGGRGSSVMKVKQYVLSHH